MREETFFTFLQRTVDFLIKNIIFLICRTHCILCFKKYLLFPQAIKTLIVLQIIYIRRKVPKVVSTTYDKQTNACLFPLLLFSLFRPGKKKLKLSLRTLYV